MQAISRIGRWSSCASLLLLSLAATSDGQVSLSITTAGPHSDEDHLEQALAQRGSIEFSETPLKQAIEDLSRQFQVPIVLARRKLEEASVSVDTPLTKKLRGLPLESILRLVLADLELAFTVRDNVILVSTPEDIESRLDTRVYPVLDLVRQPALIARDIQAAGGADYDSLIELITSTIKPDSWDDVGGPGAIDSLDNAAVLVISQTRDVQRQIEAFLTSLRRAKAIQGIPSLPTPKSASHAVPTSPINIGLRPSPAPLPSWQLPQVHSGER